eukprot:gene903-6113_t
MRADAGTRFDRALLAFDAACGATECINALADYGTA